jgi:hypothetical protein
MNILVKLHLMSKANGRTVREELEHIVESAFQVFTQKIECTPELAAMNFTNPTLAETPSNPALAFSQVVHEEVPDPTVVVDQPVFSSHPVCINRSRPSPRRPSVHGERR